MRTGLVSNNKSHHSCVSIEEPVLKDSAVQNDTKGEVVLQPVYRGCSFSSTKCVLGLCILRDQVDVVTTPAAVKEHSATINPKNIMH